MIRIQHQFRMIPIMSRRACHSNQIVYPCLPTVYPYILYSYGPQRSLLRQRCTCVELHHSFAKKNCIQVFQKEISALWQFYLSTNNPSSTNDVMMLLWICILFGECPSDFFLFSSYEWIYYLILSKKTENNLELPFSGHHFFSAQLRQFVPRSPPVPGCNFPPSYCSVPGGCSGGFDSLLP